MVTIGNTCSFFFPKIFITSSTEVFIGINDYFLS
jgi:hypothetical protein